MKPKAWSYSALNGFLTCPRQYYEMNVAKNYPYIQGSEAKWGDKVHKLIEDHIGHRIDLETDEDMSHTMTDRVLGVLDELSDMDCDIVAEGKVSLNRNLKPCGYFDEDTWVRGILDLLAFHPDEVTATIIDWKTGKVRPSDKQLKLFAILVFYLYPQIQTVHTRFEWLAYNDSTAKTYHRRDLNKLWSVFIPDLKRLKEAFLTDSWPAKKSGLCQKYCDVTGCEHNGRNR